MNEHAETKPRNRWFQFDLRLLLVVIGAIGVILALEFRPRRRPNQTSERGIADVLRVGDGATVGFEHGTSILVGKGKQYPGIISEIGRDFVAVKFPDGLEYFIAITAIDHISRHPDEPPRPSPFLYETP